MASLGQVVPPGEAAPAAGVFVCTEPGCTGSFVASVVGAPLPPAHHPGGSWRLAEIRAASAPKTPRRRAASPAGGRPASPPGDGGPA